MGHDVIAAGGLGEGELRRVADSFRQGFMTAEQLAGSFVRSAIIRGLYRPGERLQQEAIASVLGISRIPVRTALRQLEEEGLVTSSPHRGTVVRVLLPEQIKEVYELRVLIEGYLLEQALPRLTREHMAELRSLVGALEATVDESEALERRVAFYERLYSIAERPRALKIASRLRGEVDRYLLSRRVVADSSGHLALVERLERKDLTGASRWLQHHLEAVSSQLQAIVAEPAGQLVGVDMSTGYRRPGDRPRRR